MGTRETFIVRVAGGGCRGTFHVRFAGAGSPGAFLGRFVGGRYRGVVIVRFACVGHCVAFLGFCLRKVPGSCCCVLDRMFG